jgi:hypothetical protein
MKTIAIVECVVGLAACDDDSTLPPEGHELAMASVADMTVIESDLGVRRTADVPLLFQPAGLWWDSATHSLYIANDGGQQIVRWREDLNGFVVATNLPQIAPASGGLGQLIKAADGSWLVTRFGFGMAGAILQADKNNDVASIAGLMTMRQRVGLTQAADGTLYTGWYVTVNELPAMGTVSKVALDGSGETDVVTGIGKPVGVLALGDQLYISDQRNGVVLKTPLGSPGSTTTFSTIAGADELAAGPNGVIFAASSTGTVWSIASDGTPTSVHDGYKALRGVAYDPDHKRLFVSEPDKRDPDGGAAMPMLHVLPVN